MKLTTMIRNVVPILAVAALLVAAGLAPAGTIVFTSTGNGADTELENDNQGYDGTDPDGTSLDVNGANAYANFRRYDGVRAKMLMLRFDISTLDVGVYPEAKLSFDYFSNRVRTLRVYGVADGDLDLWDEGTTSYATAPGILNYFDAPPGPDAVAATFGLNPVELYPAPPTPGLNPFQLGTIGVVDTRGLPGGRAIAWSSPTSLSLGNFLAADTNGVVTLLLFHDGTDSNQTGNIATKENTDIRRPPALGVPEPASLTLLGIAMALLVANRRR